MTSVEECAAAIGRLNERIRETDEADRRKHIVPRTVSVTVTDLDTVFDLRLTTEGLSDVHPRSASEDAPRAQVTVRIGADDLVAIADDRLNPATAMLTGRVKVEASFGDLLRLRKLM